MNISKVARERALDALFDSAGRGSCAPVNSTLYWFGVALFDAVAPLTGEDPMVERWPDWRYEPTSHLRFTVI